jgi:hypothetical protein
MPSLSTITRWRSPQSLALAIIGKYHGVRKQVLTIFRQLAVIWALMRVLHTVKHLNWLDGRQQACRAERVAESAVQSIMSAVQTDVAALGFQVTYVSFPCSKQRQSLGDYNRGDCKYVADAEVMSMREKSAPGRC